MSAALPCFDSEVHRRGHDALRRSTVTTLQLNIGLRCNLACQHCHVESGPLREEAMNAAGVARILELLSRNPSLDTLDITGGAPELNPHFRELVSGARALAKRVIDRCNLTVLFEPGQEDTAEFLAREGVHLIASLPCYSHDNVERQRGRGVYGQSIQALLRLNDLGYGRGDARLRLDLVYNPIGATLPAPQAELEARYRKELRERFDIHFDSLLAITNMPIKRFAHQLERNGETQSYLSLLASHFNPGTLDGLMCRNTLSVGWDGSLYDCDFNQALGVALGGEAGAPLTIWEIDDLATLAHRRISTGRHCFGCTAGAGSSCGGTLTARETA
jgi:radical SAM/Cys-rich protein